MIFSNGAARPKIHSSAYVAPTAVVSGDVTIAAGCAVLHAAVITAEGAPITLGEGSVVMEHAVLRASGGNALSFPLKVGRHCIVGPHAYLVGATIADGCFIASGAKVFNGASLEERSGVALGGIVHVNSRLTAGASVPMQHIAFGDPATIYAPDKAPEIHAKMNFYADVFNLEASDDVRARAAEMYSKFLRKVHAQDAAAQEHRNTKPPPRRSGEEPPQTQSAQVDKVVDVMMLELEEMEERRRQAARRQKGG